MDEVRRARLHSQVGEATRLVTIAVNAPVKFDPEQLRQLMQEQVHYDKCKGIAKVFRTNHTTYEITFIPCPNYLMEEGLHQCEQHIVDTYTDLVVEAKAALRSERLRDSIYR